MDRYFFNINAVKIKNNSPVLENRTLQFCARGVAVQSGKCAPIAGDLVVQQEKSLHLKFVKLGNDHRCLTNELLAILPEIYNRRIYKKYAATIIEYAGKFGGLSKGVVLKRLRLEKYLQNKPLLREAVRTEGVHKVALVAALATPETEKAWLNKVENMSKAALQELSREVRGQREMGLENGLGMGLVATGVGESGSPGFCAVGDVIGSGLSANFGGNVTFPCRAVPVKITLKLDEEMTFAFLSLKKKLGKNLGNKEVMKKILEMAQNSARGINAQKNTDKTESEVAENGSGIGGEAARKGCTARQKIAGTEEYVGTVRLVPGDNFPKAVVVDLATQAVTRHISAGRKCSALAETNNHCSYPNCNRPPEVFHHTERFALNQSHESIKPLCKIHHEFTHNGLILDENQPCENWKMQLGDGLPSEWTNFAGAESPANWIDCLYRRRKKSAKMKWRMS